MVHKPISPLTPPISQNNIVPYGNGSYFKGFVQKSPHYPSISLAFDHLIEAVSPSISPQIHGSMVFEYLPLTKVNSVPKGATAFRRDPTPSVLVVFHWDANPENGHGPVVDRARASAYKIADTIEKHQEGVSSGQKQGYSNYGWFFFGCYWLILFIVVHFVDSAAGEPDRAKAVFGENYPRLQEVKKKYDPSNIFNKWFPIVPA